MKNVKTVRLITHFTANEPKGEMVVMVAPPTAADLPSVDVDSLLRAAMVDCSLKDAVKQITAAYNLNKNEVYAQALKIKNEQL